MTHCLKFGSILALAAQAALPSLLGQTNEAHHHDLLAKLPINNAKAYSPRAALSGYVPTNTLAFREYALSLMLTQANFVNQKWRLGLPVPITSDEVTYFSAQPKLGGIEGGLGINNRFNFGFRNGAWTSFVDLHDSAQTEHLTTVTNLLTRVTAAKVAQSSLRSIGLDEKDLRLPAPPIVTQYDILLKDGKRRTLPLYEIGWRHPESQSGPMRMEVSGITTKVVIFENYAAKAVPLPTNYYALLGISPRRNEWGRQFGYDPLDTDEFQQFARHFASDLANSLNRVWGLGFPAFTTNDITLFSAKPRTNTFDITMAQFGEKFYFQFSEGKLSLFKDKGNNIQAMTDNSKSMQKFAGMKKFVSQQEAVRLAREALHRMGFDETKLQLIEPPEVKQWALPLPDQQDGLVYKLPLYDVMWILPEKEWRKYGVGAPAVSFQISGITKKVVMYANSSPFTPAVSLPTNYFAILGLASVTNNSSIRE